MLDYYTKLHEKNILLRVPLWNLCGTLWKNLSHEDIYSAPMELIGTVYFLLWCSPYGASEIAIIWEIDK